MTGCSFEGAGGDDGMVTPGVDAARDASPDPDGAGSEPDAPVPPDAQACFGTTLTVCLNTLPTDGVTISATESLDTDSSPRCVESNHPELCVVAGTFVTVTGGGTRVRASGSRPLVLLATAGEVGIDAGASVEAYSSNFSDGTGIVGPGANAADCIRAGIDGTTIGTSGGGGAGGSFGGRGGDGSNGDSNPIGNEGGPGGVAATPASTVSELRGGCPGGTGGRPDNVASSRGGDGGGAVALIASLRVRIDGRIDAAGAGGFGSVPFSDGGGGGGSGGMIYLEGTTGAAIGVTGAIYANGGAGAGGAGSGSSPGGRGGESAGPALQAQGGAGGGSGARGGNGAFGSITDGQTPAAATGNDGGGGGGGGAGVIIMIPPIATDLAHVSPAPR